MVRVRIRVAELMRERGLTAVQLARRSSIALNTARALERGTQTRLDIPVLERIAQALNVRPLELLEEITEGNRKPGLAAA